MFPERDGVFHEELILQIADRVYLVFRLKVADIGNASLGPFLRFGGLSRTA